MPVTRKPFPREDERVAAVAARSVEHLGAGADLCERRGPQSFALGPLRLHPRRVRPQVELVEQAIPSFLRHGANLARVQSPRARGRLEGGSRSNQHEGRPGERGSVSEHESVQDGGLRERPVKEVVENGSALVVRLAGELDLYNADAVREGLFAAAARAPGRLVVDLESVTFIDSTTLGVLIEARVEADATGAGSCSPRRVSRPGVRSRCRGSTGTSPCESRSPKRWPPSSSPVVPRADSRRSSARRTASSARSAASRALAAARSAAVASCPRRRASARASASSRRAASTRALRCCGVVPPRRGGLPPRLSRALRRRRHPGHRLEPGRLELLPQGPADELLRERRRRGPRGRPDPPRRRLRHRQARVPQRPLRVTDDVAEVGAKVRVGACRVLPNPLRCPDERAHVSGLPARGLVQRPDRRRRLPHRLELGRLVGAPLLPEPLRRLGSRRRELVERQPQEALQLVRHGGDPTAWSGPSSSRGRTCAPTRCAATRTGDGAATGPRRGSP